MNNSNSSSKTRLIYGHKKYTELELGNVNILLSVPHNGILRPTDIKNRDSDVFGSLKSDNNTRRLGIGVRNELENLFLTRKARHAVPFMIVNNLHRVKMDPNRSRLESCANLTDDAHIAYQDYHGLIDQHFKRDFVSSHQYAQSLIVDLHGHSHSEEWIELGYCISRAELNKFKSGGHMIHRSSIHALATTTSRVEELIRGADSSLGGLLETRFGLKAVPSPRYPAPLTANYYSGGYITEIHGSLDESRTNSPFVSRFNAIQVEVPACLRADDTVDFFAKQLASVIFEFYFIHSLDLLL